MLGVELTLPDAWRSLATRTITPLSQTYVLVYVVSSETLVGGELCRRCRGNRGPPYQRTTTRDIPSRS